MLQPPTIPDWLNESFLQTVLKQDESLNKDVKVTSIEVTPAVPPGVNYSSDLLRARGKYQEEDNTDQVKKISVIVKVQGTKPYAEKYLEEAGICEKEYVAYTEFLPEVYKFLPKGEQFTSKLLYSLGPKTLVFEDLKEQGFVMAEQLKQLDFNHCLACMKTIAKLHAASVPIIKGKPEFIEKIKKDIMFDKQNPVSEMLKHSPCLFISVAKTWGGFEDLEERSRHVLETIKDDLCDVFQPRSDSLNVWNHGDLWLNNLMFKYDSDGNIVDLRLVDFQLCRYGSPVMDLLYFLFSSGNNDVRENRLDELFSVYLETLNSVLEQLDCEERLTREQLDAELKRWQCYVFFVCCSMLLLVLSDPDDLAELSAETEQKDIEEIFKSQQFAKGFSGKYYKVAAQQILRYLYKVGYF